MTLDVTCQQGYGVLGSSSINCFNGFWPEDFPKCIRKFSIFVCLANLSLGSHTRKRLLLEKGNTKTC